MTLHSIWQQQLTLVSYGNQFLRQNQSITTWQQHAIFYGQQFEFRDLTSGSLIAQHFQVWLEGLKAQGVQRLSLHAPQLLNKDKNPNSNVMLIDAAPVMVSHSAKAKQVWILGEELPHWDVDNRFTIPMSQRSGLNHFCFWRYELGKKHHKAIANDLTAVNWDLKHQKLSQQFLAPALAQGFAEPLHMDSPFYGSTLIEAHPNPELMDAITLLAVLPGAYPAPLAHAWLHRACALNEWFTEQPERLTIQQHAAWQAAFTQLVVDVANHYERAQLKPLNTQFTAVDKPQHALSGATVSSLLLVIVLICAAGYYFGL